MASSLVAVEGVEVESEEGAEVASEVELDVEVGSEWQTPRSVLT